jgi:hypothetical protein
MTISRFAYGVAGAAMLTAAFTVGGATPASALICVGGISGQQATGKIRFFTEGKARNTWSARTRVVFGPRFSSWNIARNKRMNCYKAAPGSTWYCMATANPCRP